MKKNTTNTTITTMEDLRSYILTCLPTLNKDLFVAMDKDNKEDLKKDFLQRYVNIFNTIQLKDNDNKVNTKALNVLYAFDSIVAFEDYTKDLEKDFVKKVVNELTTNNKEVNEDLLTYEVTKLYQNIISKAKRYIKVTHEVNKDINILMDYFMEENYSQIDTLTKELFDLTFTDYQKDTIVHGFINANKKKLFVKSQQSNKNLLFAIIRSQAVKHGLYSNKQVKLEIADIMKKVSFVTSEELEEKLKTDIGVQILAKEYDIKVGKGKNFNYTKDRPKVENSIKRNHVIITKDLLEVIQKVHG